jgi:hypothetical protein
MFARKTEAYCRAEDMNGASLRQASAIPAYFTRLERLSRHKHSSLFGPLVYYGFDNIGLVMETLKFKLTIYFH